jgi:predicted nucleotide-binding protein
MSMDNLLRLNRMSPEERLIDAGLIPSPVKEVSIALVNGEISQKTAAPAQKGVFIVHGHDETALQTAARFVEKLGLETIILREKPSQGKTVIEKFEHYAGQAGYAIVLLTPDDVGYAQDQPNTDQKRARQNVIFELGYLMKALGRDKICLLYKPGVERPSDIDGIVYQEMDPHQGWHNKVASELQAIGFPIDPVKLLS